jgi:DNA-binding transcriptional LysR family regulator
MEVHQLRRMAAVAKSGTFSRGAELYQVSQPSLSQQIHKLEDELDLIVASQPIPEDRFDQEILFDEELLLALPANHSLARRANFLNA